MSQSASDPPKPAGQFQATRWSIVLAARERSTPAGEEALGWLCERYWQPLTTWARAKGLSPEDAEDLVQGFFAQALKGGLVGALIGLPIACCVAVRKRVWSARRSASMSAFGG